jgi:hypothetical protein
MPCHAALQVLHEQLDPGELDAVVRVSRSWARRLTRDVTSVTLCLPTSYEELLALLDQQLERRFSSVHGWRLWLPAGRDWSNLDELLWLFSRYKAERLALDGQYSRPTGGLVWTPERRLAPVQGGAAMPAVDAAGACACVAKGWRAAEEGGPCVQVGCRQ